MLSSGSICLVCPWAAGRCFILTVGKRQPCLAFSLSSRAGLCWEAEAPEASVAQDVEVVVGLSVVIIRLLSAEAGRHIFLLDIACRGRRQAWAPFLLFRCHSPEATFHGMDSERFLSGQCDHNDDHCADDYQHCDHGSKPWDPEPRAVLSNLKDLQKDHPFVDPVGVGVIDAEVAPCVIHGQRLEGEAQVWAWGHSLLEGWVDVPPQVGVMNGQHSVLMLPVDLSHLGSGGGELTL